MIKISFFSFFVMALFSSFAQTSSINVFLNQSNVKIPVYNDYLCVEEKNSIFQDTIFENFYSVELIKESAFAFETKITSVSQFNSPMIVGWVEKKYCSVFLNTGKILKLFESPSEDSSYNHVEFKTNIMANVVEIGPPLSGFIKVIFYSENKLYIGWIKNYCGSIYNSCN